MSEPRVVVLDPFSEHYGQAGVLVGGRVMIDAEDGTQALDVDPDLLTPVDD